MKYILQQIDQSDKDLFTIYQGKLMFHYNNNFHCIQADCADGFLQRLGLDEHQKMNRLLRFLKRYNNIEHDPMVPYTNK